MPYADSATMTLPYQSDPDTPGAGTSRDAAVAVREAAAGQRERYYRWLAARGTYGATDREAHQALGIERSSINARRSELRKRVIYSGVVRSRIIGGKCYWSKVWIAA